MVLTIRLAILSAPLVPGTGAWGQERVVAPGEAFTLEVGGSPFYPLGWSLRERSAVLPDERYGERLLPSRSSSSGCGHRGPTLPSRCPLAMTATYRSRAGGGYYWYGYTSTDYIGGEQRHGHIRPSGKAVFNLHFEPYEARFFRFGP